MNDKTRGMIGRRALSLCKKGVRILNYARGGLVDEAALLEALADGRVAAYVTDFPSDALLGAKGVICTPHLGASTPAWLPRRRGTSSNRASSITA